MNSNMIMKTLFGSHLYGLSTPESDKDYKGIFMPSRRDILLGKIPRSINESTSDDFSKNTNQDIDSEMFSLHRFIELGCKGETAVIDMLHTKPELIVEDESPNIHIFNRLQHLRTMFYSKNMKAYIGYVKRQAHKYGIKGSRIEAVSSVIDYLNRLIDEGYVKKDFRLERASTGLAENDYCGFIQQNGKTFYSVCGRKLQMTITIEEALSVLGKILSGYGDRAKKAEENDGVDWKAVSHAFRAGYQVRDIFTKGDFEYPLKETDFILKVKRGELDFVSEVQPKLEALVDEVMNLSETTDTVPDSVNTKFWNEWLVDQVMDYHFGDEHV